MKIWSRQRSGVPMPLSKFRFVAGGILTSMVIAAWTVPLGAVPSHARQTGMACQACHTIFPELTPFGRLFKLNGYEINNLAQVQGITPNQTPTLQLNQI